MAVGTNTLGLILAFGQPMIHGLYWVMVKYTVATAVFIHQYLAIICSYCEGEYLSPLQTALSIYAAVSPDEFSNFPFL